MWKEGFDRKGASHSSKVTREQNGFNGHQSGARPAGLEKATGEVMDGKGKI